MVLVQGRGAVVTEVAQGMTGKKQGGHEYVYFLVFLALLIKLPGFNPEVFVLTILWDPCHLLKDPP